MLLLLVLVLMLMLVLAVSAALSYKQLLCLYVFNITFISILFVSSVSCLCLL